VPTSEGERELFRLLRPPWLRTLEDERRHASHLADEVDDALSLTSSGD